MSNEERTPRVLAVAWGRLEVGGIGAGKDFKLYPGGSREWDWNATGTRHSPGIQPADVEELLAHGATVVALFLGMNRGLQVDPRTLDYLAGRSVTVHAAVPLDLLTPLPADTKGQRWSLPPNRPRDVHRDRGPDRGAI